MSDVVNIYRTDTSVAKKDFFATLNKMLEDYVFKDGDDLWINSIDKTTTTNQVDYKLTSDLWLRIKQTNPGTSATVSAYIVKSGTESQTDLLSSFSSFFLKNVTIIRVNKCIAFCCNGAASNPSYTYAANLIVDSINNNSGFAILEGWAANSYGVTAVTDTVSASRNNEVYMPFTQKSYRQNVALLQIAPFVNNANGAKLDNLYGVMTTPIQVTSGNIVDFNSQKWWLSGYSYFALPLGSAVPDITEIPTVTS